MAKKGLFKLMALAATAGAAAAGISYLKKYQSFSKELDENFHDFEDEEETPIPDSTMNRNYVSLHADKDELLMAAGDMLSAARDVAGAAKNVVRDAAAIVADTTREAMTAAGDTAAAAKNSFAEAASEAKEAASEAVETVENSIHGFGNNLNKTADTVMNMAGSSPTFKQAFTTITEDTEDSLT